MKLIARTLEALEMLQAHVYERLGTRQGTRNFLPLALDLYKKVLDRCPDREEALFGLGMVHKSMRDFSKATSAFSRLGELYPTHFHAKIQLALTHFLQNDHDSSLDTCNSLLKIDSVPDDVQALALFQIAQINWLDEEKRMDKPQCLSILLQSAKKDPTAPHTFNYLGHYYQLQNDRVRALKCFRKAHSLVLTEGSSVMDNIVKDPSQALCSMLLKDGDIEDALQVLEDMIEKNDRDFWAQRQRGFIEASLHRQEVAIGHLQAALRINPDDSLCWEVLADAYLDEGKFMASLKAYRRSMDLSKESSSIYAMFKIACIHQKLGQLDEAVVQLLAVRGMVGGENLCVANKLAECLLLSAQARFSHII